MEWVETTGRTIEEAKDAALDQLGVDESDAEFEVVEEPKSGLFGRLRSEARVRARVRPTRPRPKDERRSRRKPRDRGERQPARSATGGGDSPAGDAPRRERPPRERQRPARPRANDDDGGSMVEDVPMEQQAEVAREFLAGLVQQFGAAGSVEVRPIDEDTVELAIVGDDLGLLIGPKGQTLGAVQELARTVVQRKTGGRNGRLVVDVGGYREARRAALTRFTQQVAAEVKESGRARGLEPMSPADRKVVHDTANEIDGVSTTSEGEEPRRRVVILPG